MNTYRFWLEATDPKSGETVRFEWNNLTMLEAKKLYKLTDTKYAVNDYVATIERYGWEEIK